MLSVVVAALAAVLFAAAFPDAILAGDAAPYRQRMGELFAGKVPYIDFAFEHLPGSLVPMALAWLLGGYQDLQRYAFALAGVSAAFLVVTALCLRRLESHVGEGLSLRWLILVVPLMPFLLFRNDNWTVALVVGAFVLAVSGRRGGATGLIAAGVASKFWPVAWIPVEWWQGRRKQALALFLLGIGALVLLRTEPVLQIQQPVGVHTESLAGSAFGLVRTITHSPLQVVRTSAAYMDVPWWAHLVNLLPALGLGAWSLRVLRTPFTWKGAWLLAGSATGAIMIASPLLSTQFLAWLAPFSAAAKRSWFVALLVNSVSLVLIMSWSEMATGQLWWWVVLVIRNGLLLVQVLLLLAAMPQTMPVERTSLLD